MTCQSFALIVRSVAGAYHDAQNKPAWQERPGCTHLAPVLEFVTRTCVAIVLQEMTARYEAGKAEANATLEAQRAAAADAQAAITQAAESKLSKLQLQVCSAHTLPTSADLMRC